MRTKSSAGGVPHVLLSLVLLLAFGQLFFTQYKTNVNCHEVRTNKNLQVCANRCLNALNDSFVTNVSTRTLKQLSPINKPDSTEEHHENQDPDTLLLVWSWPFGYRFKGESCNLLFGIKGCQITDQRSQYDKAHGVMFHHNDITNDFTDLLNMVRPPYQKWVWMNMESPDNSKRWTEFDGLFNLSATYRKDSDVWVPYGRIVPKSEKNKTFQIPTKDKLVCWIVSNWHPSFRRVKYFNELSQHIKVEAYGRHFNRYINSEDYDKIVSSCKFYLSFENSFYIDYFTEKLFNPLMSGTVPVVLGPPRENYEEYIPSDSFIHVDDFKSPQELAEHLKNLDQNQEAYERYFTWRQHFTADRTLFGVEQACRTCHHIKQHKGYKVLKNLGTWFWG